MKIIMISGKSGSGKDQLGLFLKEQLEREHKRVLTIHFGDLVKFFLSKYYKWDGNKDINGRTMLQRLGTDMIRKKFPHYWGNAVSQFIAATAIDWDYVLIPDWRFLNELSAIERYNKNVITVRINRLNEDGTYQISPQLTAEQAQHISECELDTCYFDWLVDNSGTLDELQESATILLKEIG